MHKEEEEREGVVTYVWLRTTVRGNSGGSLEVGLGP